MRCHICLNTLDTGSGRKPDFSKDFSLDCRSHSCPMRQVVERCRLYYHPNVSKYFYSYCLFWIPEDNYWYKIKIDYTKTITVERTAVTLRPGKTPLGGQSKVIFEYEGLFNVSVDDDLPEKVPKILRRAKKLVIFS